uniref:Uncharacterized protein n=1 Tax=Anguilla anguilla TaxID=7936 RepID=A0A0E9VW19_ANGAN
MAKYYFSVKYYFAEMRIRAKLCYSGQLHLLLKE